VPAAAAVTRALLAADEMPHYWPIPLERCALAVFVDLPNEIIWRSALYPALLIDTLALARAAGVPVTLSLPPQPYELDLPETWRVVQQPQRPYDRRLAQVFDTVFRYGAQGVVVIGIGTPHLPPQRLREAFAALDTHDLVIGPGTAGGWYALGLREPAPWLVEGLPWASVELAARLHARAQAHGLAAVLLPEEEIVAIGDPASSAAAWLAAEPWRAPLTARALRGEWERRR
jgi:hypothetical protein